MFHLHHVWSVILTLRLVGDKAASLAFLPMAKPDMPDTKAPASGYGTACPAAIAGEPFCMISSIAWHTAQ